MFKGPFGARNSTSLSKHEFLRTPNSPKESNLIVKKPCLGIIIFLLSDDALWMPIKVFRAISPNNTANRWTNQEGELLSFSFVPTFSGVYVIGMYCSSLS